MYDTGKILTGLLVFLGLATFPFWYGAASGKAAERPQIKLPAEEKQCLEPTAYMRSSHMDLLNRWRDSVVRDGNLLHTAPGGKTYEMSLTNTCLRCHEKKAEFCDKCHDYVAVTPYCFDCHVDPKGKA